MNTTQAIYFDGKTPIRRIATLHLEGDHLHIEVDSLSDSNDGNKISRKTYLISFLQIERIRHDLIVLHLNHSQGEKLEIVDSDFIEKIEQIKPSKDIDVTKNVSSNIVLALLVVIIVTALLWQGAPLAARFVARNIPVETENQAQEYVASQMKGQICVDKKPNEILQALGDKLLRDNNIDHPLKIHYGSSMIVNAFALPGGNIIIHPGIIKKMKKPEALAGVLAHEIQHQVQRHITTQLVRTTLMTVVWNAALGDFSGFLFLDPSTLIQIANLKHSRNDEREADEKGADMLVGSHISVKPMLEFLDELTKMSGADFIPEFLMSHPQEGRGRGLLEKYKDQTVLKEPIVSDADWVILQQGCKTETSAEDLFKESK